MCVLALCLAGLASTPARADDLTDARSRVRRAIASTQADLAEARDAVETAAAKLQKSQADLEEARAELEFVNGALARARAEDGRIAQALAEAQQALAAAKDAEAKSEADVAAQRKLIGVAVRTAYQQQTALTGVGVALGAETTADLAQRLHWSTTIFDTSSAELDRLSALQAALEAARKARAEAERLLTEQRRTSREHLAATQALAEKAAATKALVTGLVAENEKNMADAEADLLADQKAYDKLQAQDRSIQAQIKARIEAQKRSEAKAKADAAAAKAKTGKAPGNAAEPSPTKSFVSPVDAKPGSPFGMRFHPILRYWRMHWGTDFGASCGAPIVATADGVVASARWQGGFGNYVVIDHGKVSGSYLSSGYAHQSRMAVRAGQRVEQGQIIGYVGTTGLSTGCHLHFQIYANGTPVNPMRYL